MLDSQQPVLSESLRQTSDKVYEVLPHIINRAPDSDQQTGTGSVLYTHTERELI